MVRLCIIKNNKNEFKDYKTTIGTLITLNTITKLLKGIYEFTSNGNNSNFDWFMRIVGGHKVQVCQCSAQSFSVVLSLPSTRQG